MSLSGCFVNMNLTGYATEVKYIVTKDKFILDNLLPWW